jgi:hypothetical protein
VSLHGLPKRGLDDQQFPLICDAALHTYVVRRSKTLLRSMYKAESRRFQLAGLDLAKENTMNDVDRAKHRRAIEALGGRLLLVMFGLGVLGFLVAIDRPDWFAIRPATGTSIAMANAANTVAPNPGAGTGKSIIVQ